MLGFILHVDLQNKPWETKYQPRHQGQDHRAVAVISAYLSQTTGADFDIHTHITNPCRKL